MVRKELQYRLSLILYIGAIFILGFIPEVKVLPIHFDLSFLFHGVGFFYLYLMLYNTTRSKLKALILSLLFGVLLEAAQTQFPERQADITDIFYDLVGILVAFIIGSRGKELVFKLTGTFMGIGYIPVGPGTISSLIFVILYYLASGFGTINLLEISLVLIPLGIYISGYLEELWGEDPRKVVIDEVCGMAIALLFLKRSLLLFALAFILFRFFDIYKPCFIKIFEKPKGGMGIMLDDVAAGLFSLAIIQILLFLLHTVPPV